MELEDDFKLEIMTAIELPMKILWPPKDKGEKLIPEVKVFWLNKYLGCSLSVQEPGRLLFMS